MLRAGIIVMSSMKQINQKGIASIIITMIMSLVLTLIALGFTQVSLNQQKQALDSALSTQAFYSAESGVNYGIHEIITDQNQFSASFNQSSCQKPSNKINELNSTQDEWTCLMVNLPRSLIYNVQNNSAVLVPIKTEHNPTKLNYINISWRNHPFAGNNFNGCQNNTNHFPPTSDYNSNCPASVLQVSVLPGNQLDNLDNPDPELKNYYLTPSSSSSTYNWSNNGSDNLAHCSSNNGSSNTGSSNTGYCNASIPVSGSTIPGNSPNDYQYYLYIIPLYSTTKLYVTAYSSAETASSQMGYSLYNAQVDIDSTGKGYDVLKRILVTVNTGIGVISGSSGNTSSSLNLNQVNTNNQFALQTGGNICKELSYNPTNYSVDDNC